MSVNVVVGLILGIMMLSAGIIIFNQIYSKSTQLSLDVEAQTRDRMLRSFIQDELLFVPETDKDANSKGPTIFHFGIRNIFDEKKTFTMSITALPNPPLSLPAVPKIVALYLTSGKPIPAKDKEIFKMLVDTENLPSGQYSIVIEIRYVGMGAGAPPYAKRIVRVNV